MKFFHRLIFVSSCFFVTQTYAFSDLEIKQIIQNAATPLDIVKHFIPENPRILEAGAHYGEDSLKMHWYWPNGELFCFEPNPGAYARLESSVSSISQIHTYPIALYNYNGITSFNVQLTDGNDGASSILNAGPIHSWYYRDQPIEVPCCTLDSWAEDNQVSNIDFMWLDMEGVELQVLKASPRILSTVKVIFTETNFHEFRLGMTQYSQLKSFLYQSGFVEIHHMEACPGQGNAIFIRK